MENFLDKGHLIARKFQKYIYNNAETDKFFCKNITLNIIYQFCDKNRGYGDKLGQLQFEQAVKKGFNDKNKRIDIHYEVEPIFLPNMDAIPIGTRILAFRRNEKCSCRN